MIVAGICFIVPAALIVVAMAWAYVRYGALPSFQSAFYGVKPVVVAIVAQAIARLVEKVLDSWPKRIALVAAGALAWFGVSAIAVLLGSGGVFGAGRLYQTKDWRSALPVLGLLGGIAALAAFPLASEFVKAAPTPNPGSVFLYFFKVGSVLYGGGYVLLAFLDRDLVGNWHWLTKGRLLDAIAVGQFTPGPVFTTATFIGYVLAGPWGAVTATVGIFVPAFVFVGLVGKFLPRLRLSPVSGGFLDGVNAAALALMSVVTIRLAADAIRDPLTAAIALTSLALLLRFKLNSALLILAGAAIGLAAYGWPLLR